MRTPIGSFVPRIRLVLPLVLASTVIAWGTPSTATADNLQAPPLLWGAGVIDSPMGFFGCVYVQDIDPSFCFAAQSIVDGPDSGSVSVTTAVVTPPSFPSRPVAEPVVYEEVVPSSAFSQVDSYSLTLQADLQGVGIVDLRVYSAHGLTLSSGSAGCPLEGVQGEAAAATAVVGSSPRASGTIDGHRVRFISPGCAGFWVGPAVGYWYMPYGGY